MQENIDMNFIHFNNVYILIVFCIAQSKTTR